MRNRMLRSILVAAFSTVVAFGVLSGLSETKSDSRADSSWPSKVQTVTTAQDSSWPANAKESSGEQESA